MSCCFRFRLAHAASAAALAVAAACATPAAQPGDDCTRLATLELIDLRIGAAEHVPGGESGTSHCRVTGVIETEINFEVLLPDDWNGRFLMGGGGGFVGTVENQARSVIYNYGGGPLERGYATAGTDTGHTGSAIDGSWALNHPERQENFGHRAVHLTAEAAKSLISHYYGQPADYSYFVGCSRGGGQAMVESQRYPEDFDGIVAAAPAYDWTGIATAFLQNQQAIYPAGDDADPLLTPAALELLGSSILAACDADDGVADGMLNDPRQCAFDPADLPRCAAGRPGDDCLTAEQLAAVRRVYDGPTVDGEQVYHGFNYGGENDLGGWDAWVVGPTPRQPAGPPNAQFGFSTGLFKYFIASDPDWDYTQYDFSSWREDIAGTAAILNATDPDLGRFRDHGGRIIYWTGWSDLALAPLGTIDYYERLAAGDPAARDYARLYMLPGVLHCAGGPGPDRVDWVEAIRAWVEDANPPEALLASKLDQAGAVTMTRPLCPYPQTAVYDGTGDPNDAASFTCAAPE